MKDKQQLIYGRHPIVDAIESGQTIDKVLIQQGLKGDVERELRQLSKTHGFPLQYVPKERLNKFTRGNHQGVIAFISLMPYYQLEDVLPGIFERSEVPLILLLDGVTDVRNFGAIARSAEIAGVHAIVTSLKGSALINADAMKTSAGALAKVPVCRESSIMQAVELLRLSGVRVLASDLQSSTPIYKVDLKQPTAIIIGSESEGVNRAFIQAADETFIIPQKGTTDSFNVSVAAGIMLYEAMRQRMA